MQSGIPARLIQTGKSRSLTLAQRAATTSLRCLNPEFEYQFFDDDDVIAFIDSEFPDYREIFDGFPFRIQKYDFFRYLAVFRFGGFYFDIDIFFATGLHELLTHSCVFTFEELTINGYLRDLGMDWEVGNYAFGAAPGHPFLEAVIQNCIRSQRDPEWVKPMMRGIPVPFRPEFRVLNTTVGGMLSRTMVENPHLTKDMTVLFPADVCDESTWHQFGDFGVHIQQGSWRSTYSYLRRKLADLWEARVRRRLLRESIALGKTRALPLKAEARGQKSEVRDQTEG